MNPRTFSGILKNESGMALLITLSIIAILFAVSMELNRRVRTSILASETGKTEYQLLELAESGLNLAKAILVKDANKNTIDSIQEEWSDPKALDEILKSGEMIKSLTSNGGSIEVKISDEMGKIQVNALINEYPGHRVNLEQQQIWENLLSFFISSDKSEDERNPKEIINCLIDWLDDKDGETTTGLSGAESSYYESLEIPYKPANREFVDLDELFLVKGISKGLLSKAESLDPMFSDPDDPELEFPLEDMFTVFGATQKQAGATLKKYYFPGKININTAPLPVVAAILPFGKQDLAETICEYRLQRADGESSYTNDLSIKGWYAGVAGLSATEKGQMEKIITYSSNGFTIESHVRMNNRSLVLKSVVLRKKDKNGKWYCKTLRQQMD
jgi:general secretion pathway protein K